MPVSIRTTLVALLVASFAVAGGLASAESAEGRGSQLSAPGGEHGHSQVCDAFECEEVETETETRAGEGFCAQWDFPLPHGHVEFLSDASHAVRAAQPDSIASHAPRGPPAA